MRKHKRGTRFKVERDTSVSDEIKLRVANYWRNRMRVSYFELGLCAGGRLRADVFSLAMSGHVVVTEVKSSIADFKSDKKMDKYLDYANKVYLAIPSEIWTRIKALGVHPEIGVMTFDPDLRTKPKIVKSARNREIESDITSNLIIRAAFRNADNSNRKNKRA